MPIYQNEVGKKTVSFRVNLSDSIKRADRDIEADRKPQSKIESFILTVSGEQNESIELDSIKVRERDAEVDGTIYEDRIMGLDSIS